MLKRGGGLGDEDGAEAGVRGTQGSKDLEAVRKGDERWYNRCTRRGDNGRRQTRSGRALVGSLEDVSSDLSFDSRREGRGE